HHQLRPGRVRGGAGVRDGVVLGRVPAPVRGGRGSHSAPVDAAAGAVREGGAGEPAAPDGRAAARHRHHRVEPVHPVLAAAVLDTARSAVPAHLLAQPDPGRRGGLLGGRGDERPLREHRDPGPPALHLPDEAGLGHAGGGPEPDAGVGAGHQRVAAGGHHLHAERGVDGRGRDPDRARLPREVRHRDRARPQGLLRGVHRRFQPDPGRPARRPARGRGRDLRGRLHLELLPRRVRPDHPHRRAPLEARGDLGREGGVVVVTARRLGLLAVVAICALLPLGLEQYKLYVASLTLVYVILAIRLNLTLGYAGQISLAHAAFMAFGSYAVAILGQRGVPFEVGLVVGAVAAFGSGLVVGFPALKVKHHYLAMVTVGFNIILFLVIRN